MEKVLTWAQHSSSKGFNLDPNLQRWIEIVGPEWTHIAAKKTFHVSQSDWSLTINQSSWLIDWLIGRINPFQKCQTELMSLSSFSSEQLTLGEKFIAKGGRSSNTWDGILKFYNFWFCVEMHFCQEVFLYRIYEVDLLQGRDILNVKSPVPTFLSFPKPF